MFLLLYYSHQCYTALYWQDISLQLYSIVLHHHCSLIKYPFLYVSVSLIQPCCCCVCVQNCLIRLTSRGREALVTDFGLAREVMDLPVKDQGRKLSLVGSAFWMAPEMLRGEPYDRKVAHTLLPVLYTLHSPVSNGCCFLLNKKLKTADRKLNVVLE